MFLSYAFGTPTQVVVSTRTPLYSEMATSHVAEQQTSSNNPVLSPCDRGSDAAGARQIFVPSGFECVAHPVFFQAASTPPSAANAHEERRNQSLIERCYYPQHQASTRSSATNSGSGRAWDSSSRGRLRLEHQPRPQEFVTGSSLVKSELFGDTRDGGTGIGDARDSRHDEAVTGGSAEDRMGLSGTGVASGREVDRVCPICLGRFEDPVTLTSCLHSFCHTW